MDTETLVETMAKAIRSATITERSGAASGHEGFDAITHKYAAQSADLAWDDISDEARAMWRGDAQAALSALLGAFPDHFVIFTEDRWTIEHSMACRLSGEMELCSYHVAIEEVYDQAPDPEDLGKWRIVNIDSEGLPSLERVGGHSDE